jgi:Protein of unknown function (DUF4089)
MRRKAARKIITKRKPARTKSPGEKRDAAKAAQPPDALDALVMAGAGALGLAIDPAWQASVKFNLHLILRHGALVDEFTLPDDTEPAPIFRA